MAEPPAVYISLIVHRSTRYKRCEVIEIAQVRTARGYFRMGFLVAVADALMQTHSPHRGGVWLHRSGLLPRIRGGLTELARYGCGRQQRHFLQGERWVLLGQLAGGGLAAGLSLGALAANISSRARWTPSSIRTVSSTPSMRNVCSGGTARTAIATYKPIASQWTG